MNTELAVLSIEHEYERVAFRILFAVLCFLLTGYLYFVGASVFNIIARKDAARSTISLQTSISVMEKQYFSLTDTLTPDDASALGLAPIDAAQYVYRPGNTASILRPTTDTIAHNAL